MNLSLHLLLPRYPCEGTALIKPLLFCWIKPHRFISCYGFDARFLIANTLFEVNFWTGFTSFGLASFFIYHSSLSWKLPEIITYSPINPYLSFLSTYSSIFNCTLPLLTLDEFLCQSADVLVLLLYLLERCSD